MPDISQTDTSSDPFVSFLKDSDLTVLGEDTDTLPAEVREFLTSQGMNDRTSFAVSLNGIPENLWDAEDISVAICPYIKSFSRQVPTLEYIAREYGPGGYLLSIGYREKSPSGKPKGAHVYERIKVFISEQCRDEYESQLLNRKIENAKRVQKDVTKARMSTRIERDILGNMEDMKRDEPQKNVKDLFRETVQDLKEMGSILGIQANNAPVKSPFEWDKIAAFAIPLGTALIGMFTESRRAREESNNKMLMLLMQNSQSSKNELIELMKLQQGAGSGSAIAKEYMDMARGLLDLKQTLQGPERESVLDRVLGMVGQFLPAIINVAQMSSEAKARDPMVHAARAVMEKDPNIQAVVNDPTLLVEAVKRLDHNFGWVQADMILSAMDWTRPIECSKLPNQKYELGNELNNSEKV